MKIPQQYTSTKATPTQQAIYSSYKEIVRKLNNIKDNQMNQEKTRHKFHEVLKWVADGEQVEVLKSTTWHLRTGFTILFTITNTPELYEPCDFRIKPKITTKTISGTFFLKSTIVGRNSSTITLETLNNVVVEDFAELSKCLVRIVTDEWYNELVSCKEQLDKLTSTKGN